MVMLGSRDAPSTPGRYWGEGQGPTASPSQASILLARINSRARERKSGTWQPKPREEAEPTTPVNKTPTVQDGTPREEEKQESQSFIEAKVNGVKTGEQGTVEVEDVKKKRKKKHSEEEESKGVTEDSESLLNSQKEGDDSETPITKKKKKKRKREEDEEAQREGEKLQSVITETEEIDLIKKKKKKKRHKEVENEEEREESSGIKIKKEISEQEGQINGGRTEDLSEDQRKKKKRNREGEEEENQKTIEAEQTQTQQEEDIDVNLPTKKKKKKDKELELKEEKTLEESKSNQNVSSLTVPKKNIKQETADTPEGVVTENQVTENHVEGMTEETEGKDGQDAEKVTKKTKKKPKKPKKKKKDKLKNKEVEGFTLLTEVETTKRQKVQRTLPHWLAHPTVIGRDLMADGAPVDSLPGLDSSLTDHLKQNKIQQLFPVQKAVIPEILASAGPLSCRYQPRDVCVSAPTGSGKTLAYVVPLVQALKSRTVPRIRALVLLPVQELANQVFHVFQSYCKGTVLRVGKAVGHSTLLKEQTALVAHHLGRHHSLIDILVATPGRLADHLRMTRGLDLSALRYLVLDEADRMLAAEGGEWVGHVQRAITDHQARQENQLLLRPPLQRLLFSATLSSDPEQLQHVTLHHPKLFTVGAAAAGQNKSMAVVMGQFIRPEELKEEFVLVEEEVKPLALHHLLVSGEGRQRVLVFTNSVQTTHKLALLLAALFEGSSRVVAEFSSKRDKRQQILSQFIAGKIDVLVSSDAMARGLDVPDIDHVVSYDVTAATTYVHRIGRTARAGRPGTALSLVTKKTLVEFRRALSGEGEAAAELTLTPEELEPYEQQYIDALTTLKNTLEEEERQKRLNIPNGKINKKKKQLKQRQRRRKNRLNRIARLGLMKNSS